MTTTTPYEVQGNTASKSKSVVVSEANGYLSSWIIKYFLENGYSVNALVDISNHHKPVTYLRELRYLFPRKLHVWAVNHGCEESLKDILDGNKLFIHFPNSDNALSEIPGPGPSRESNSNYSPAMILAAQKTRSLEKIILSVNAISEASSPILREMTDGGINLIQARTGALFGPTVENSHQTHSGDYIKRIIAAPWKSDYQNRVMGFVDVRDAARGIFLAGDLPISNSNLYLINQFIQTKDLSQLIIKSLGSQMPLFQNSILTEFRDMVSTLFNPKDSCAAMPIKFVEEFYKYLFLEDIGIKATSMDATLRDQMEQLRAPKQAMNNIARHERKLNYSAKLFSHMAHG